MIRTTNNNGYYANITVVIMTRNNQFLIPWLFLHTAMKIISNVSTIQHIFFSFLYSFFTTYHSFLKALQNNSISFYQKTQTQQHHWHSVFQEHNCMCVLFVDFFLLVQHIVIKNIKNDMLRDEQARKSRQINKMLVDQPRHQIILYCIHAPLTFNLFLPGSQKL